MNEFLSPFMSVNSFCFSFRLDRLFDRKKENISQLFVFHWSDKVEKMRLFSALGNEDA